MMRRQPLREGPERDDAPGVFNGGVDLFAIANDAGIAHQPLTIARRETRDPRDIEACVGLPKGVAFPEDRLPRQAGLIDFQDEPLEKLIVIRNRETVFLVVIRTVDGMVAREIAIAHDLETEIYR